MEAVNDILKSAIEQSASDIHFTVGIPPIARVDGALIHLGSEALKPADTRDIAYALMDEKYRFQLERKGEVDLAYSVPNLGRFRVNVFLQRGSVAIAVRVLNMDIPQPERLGLPESVVDVVKKQRGLVLVTGPTGSGKSTTLASLINVLNENYPYHIITLEDPIEYLHRHKKAIVNQREMGTDSDTYASALRAALRQDPDVILVGEMRDLETISIAVTAAETGPSGLLNPPHHRRGQHHRPHHRRFSALSAAADQDAAGRGAGVRGLPTAHRTEDGEGPHRGRRGDAHQPGDSESDPGREDIPDPVRHADEQENGHADDGRRDLRPVCP